jgi:hypothetical protein
MNAAMQYRTSVMYTVRHRYHDDSIHDSADERIAAAA